MPASMQGELQPTVYRFKFGGFEIANILDGKVVRDGLHPGFGPDRSVFAYMESWPITVVQAPTNSEAEFTQDIVVRFKASERGTAAVMEPRKFQRHRALSTSSSSGA